MIQTVTDLPPRTLGFRASGKITSEEYRTLMEPIYAVLERGEKLNIYFELAEDFHGLDMGALWQDSGGRLGGLKHRSSWQRMALVTDKDWVRHGASAFGRLAPGDAWGGRLVARPRFENPSGTRHAPPGWPRPRARGWEWAGESVRSFRTRSSRPARPPASTFYCHPAGPASLGSP